MEVSTQLFLNRQRFFYFKAFTSKRTDFTNIIYLYSNNMCYYSKKKKNMAVNVNKWSA